MAREVFANFYKLDAVSGTTYTVADANGTLPGTQPIDTAVVVRSPGDKVLDSTSDTFRVGTGSKAPEFTYVGTISDASGKVVGMVGELFGQRYMFSEQSGFVAGQALKINAVSSAGHTQWALTREGPLCFMPGTRVATPDGEAAVETLKAGDLVLTQDGAAAPVRWIGRQTFSRVFGDPMRILPVLIRAGSLGEGLPKRDLRVSPDHAILVDGVLVQAAALVNGSSILRDDTVDLVFTYYHVELADHALVLAEGVPAETFIDNVDRMAFENWDEHEAAATPAPMTEMALPRVRSARQLPATTRARLAAVAATLPASGIAAAA